MIPKSENPAAGGTASGANSRTVGLIPYTSRQPDCATLEGPRAAHLMRPLGVPDHTGAILAVLAFAGCAS